LWRLFWKRGAFFWWRDESAPERVLAPESHVAGLLKIGDNGYITLELDGRRPDERGPLGILSRISSEGGFQKTKNIASVLKAKSILSESNIGSDIKNMKFSGLDVIAQPLRFDCRTGRQAKRARQAAPRKFSAWRRLTRASYDGAGAARQDLTKQRLPAPFGNEHDMVFALPSRVA